MWANRLFSVIFTGLLSFSSSKIAIFIGGGPPSIVWFANGITILRLIRCKTVYDYVFSILTAGIGIALAQIDTLDTLFSFKLAFSNSVEFIIGSMIFKNICDIDKYWNFDTARFIYGFILSGIISSIPAACSGAFFINNEFPDVIYVKALEEWFVGDASGNCITIYMSCIFLSWYNNFDMKKNKFFNIYKIYKQKNRMELFLYFMLFLFIVVYVYLSFLDVGIITSFCASMTSVVLLSTVSIIFSRLTSCICLFIMIFLGVLSSRIDRGFLIPIVSCGKIGNKLLLPHLYLTFLTIISSLSVLFSEKYSLYMKERCSEKNAFFSHVSHEFRTPLSIIIEFSENILHNESEILSEKTMSDISLIHDSSLTLKYMIDDILCVFSLNKKMESYIKMICVTEFISTIDKLMRQIVSDKNHTIEIKHSLPEIIFIDVIRVKQLVTNLVSNASKYTNPNGKIDVIFEIDYDMLKCSVKDSGRGIPESSQSEIFEMFYRCENGKDQIGVGLGLSVCKKILDSLGGDIQVDSKIGIGSCFSFRVPCLRKECSPEHEILPNGVTSGLRILIIEDSLPNAMLLGRILLDMCNIYEYVQNGKDAIEKIQSCPRYDLIMLDLGLPGDMDGVDILRWIRGLDKKSEKKDVPVIIISAHVLHKDMEECSRYGANGFTKKPFTRDEIKKGIQKLNLSNASTNV